MENTAFRTTCGTYGGYQSHTRNKETPCEPCRKASRDYANANHKKRREINPDYRKEKDSIYSKKYTSTHQYNKKLATNFPVIREQCGTYAGVRRHMRRAEQLCAPCYEARKMYSKNYQDKHREKTRAANKTSRIKHKEKIKAQSKIYREQNLEELRAKNRQYHYDNPDKTREKARRRRAIRQNNGHVPYTEDQVLAVYGTICHLCNSQIDLLAPRAVGKPGWELGLHIDHVLPIIAGGPDTLDNVRPSHAICNLRKGSTTMSEETTTPLEETVVEAPVEDAPVADETTDAPADDVLDESLFDEDALDEDDFDDEDLDDEDFDDEDSEEDAE